MIDSSSNILGSITIVYYGSGSNNMDESFYVDYSWIQDFEADFQKKVSLKMLNRQILIASLIYFQFILRQLIISTWNC